MNINKFLLAAVASIYFISTPLMAKLKVKMNYYEFSYFVGTKHAEFMVNKKNKNFIIKVTKIEAFDPFNSYIYTKKLAFKKFKKVRRKFREMDSNNTENGELCDLPFYEMTYLDITLTINEDYCSAHGLPQASEQELALRDNMQRLVYKAINDPDTITITPISSPAEPES